jgi:hypothetical protein
LTCYHLWGRIAGAPTSCLKGIIGALVSIGEAEVDYFYVFVLIKQKILWFEVPMNYVQGMKIINPIDYLLKVPASLVLSYPALSNDVIKKLTATGILHDKVKLTLSLYDLIELHYIRVSYHLENVDLSSHSLNVGHIRYLFLLKDLNSDLLPCEIVFP